MSDKMTIHVREKDEVLRWIKQMEIEHDLVYESRKSEVYTAIMEVSRDNEDALLTKLQEIQDE